MKWNDTDDRQGIYIHIPFCVRKCRYCDFLSAPSSAEVQAQYVQSLCREIRMSVSAALPGEDSGRAEAASVFVGGGTPSILDAGLLEKVMETLRSVHRISPGAEITVECNPGTLSREKLKRYRAMGVNRLSLGLQSTDNEELKKLGRIHSWEEFLDNYEAARKEGFSNINIDLMSALPGQSADSWEKTLQQVLLLEPEHISAYSLIIEEGTPFYDLYHEEEERRDRGEAVKELPSEEEERAMYVMTGEILEQAGFHRYEISNYAREGFESIHNSGYWLRRPYRGYGLGSASLVREGGREIRFHNTTSLPDYLAGDFSRKEEQCLTEEEAMEETMFLGLRRMEGVSREAFRRRFGVSMESVYGAVLRGLEEEELLGIEGDRVFLTPRGIDVSNRVMAEFLL